MCFRYPVYLVLFFACFSLTEVFVPLQSYWSLSCDHELHCIAAMS